MLVNGRDCTLVIKTAQLETAIPYSEETIRPSIVFSKYNPSIEGGGTCRVSRNNSGTAGCFVSSLTICAAPLLFYLAMGESCPSVFVSGTKNIYRHCLYILPHEDATPFGVIQDRGGDKMYFPSCRVTSFEFRVQRNEAIKLKLDISGIKTPVSYPYTDTTQSQTSKMTDAVIGRERFSGDNVSYFINDKEYKNIYGFTLLTKKEKGVRTEIWIKRALEEGRDLPETIEKMAVEASLLRDKYEERRYGKFIITVTNVVLVSDETSVETADSVIGPLRYFVNGSVSIEAFTSGPEEIA